MRNVIKISTVIIAALCTVLFSAMAVAYTDTSDSYSVTEQNNLTINCSIPIKIKTLEQGKQKYDIELSLMGFIPLRKATVNIIESGKVCLLGTPFGMKVYTEGVLVIALSEVDTLYSNQSPAKISGLKVGDSIITIDGEKVYTNEDVAEIVEKSAGKPLEILIKRDDELKKLKLTPLLSKSANRYKAGIWVRDSSAGIGTLTFYSPEHNIICGLGHSINDSDTGQILKISSGEIVKAEIVSLTKASAGKPGELQGRLINEKQGDIILNSDMGIYANAVCGFTVTQLNIAAKNEIKDGQAEIFTCISGETPKKYSCSVKININSKNNCDMIVTITDKELIDSTGGIIQGMSGSPIIQNGKLIGAVTHVLVDNPEKGYGIFAENMLETARSAVQLKKAG